MNSELERVLDSSSRKLAATAHYITLKPSNEFATNECHNKKLLEGRGGHSMYDSHGDRRSEERFNYTIFSIGFSREKSYLIDSKLWPLLEQTQSANQSAEGIAYRFLQWNVLYLLSFMTNFKIAYVVTYYWFGSEKVNLKLHEPVLNFPKIDNSKK